MFRDVVGLLQKRESENNSSVIFYLAHYLPQIFSHSFMPFSEKIFRLDVLA